jgi:hypothetical protein
LNLTVLPDYLVACAGVIYILAFLIINQIVLRCMLLVGSAFYIAYYSVVAGEPLWAAIFTNLGISLANLVGLLILLFRNSRLAVPRKHSDIYPIFSLLPPGDFRALIRLGERRVLEEDAVLTRDGAPVETLYFVLKGEIAAQKAGRILCPARPDLHRRSRLPDRRQRVGDDAPFQGRRGHRVGCPRGFAARQRGTRGSISLSMR